MKPVTIGEIAIALGAGWSNCHIDLERKVTGISTDSREEMEGKLFIPLEGQRFDGHSFIAQAMEKGAVACLSHKDIANTIRVANTGLALMDLAAWYRNRFDIKVVAITGSAGKTTTKDMVASVLEEKYRVLKTQGNFNNEIGLPLTLFKLEDHQAAVLELGMNHFGELHNLSRVARPDIAVITNIGYAHIENLGSREGIRRAKCEIFDYLKPGGIKIINGDDDMLKALEDKDEPYLRFGIESGFDFTARDITEKGLDGADFIIGYGGGKSFPIHTPLSGKHMIYNALAAAAVGVCMGLEPEQIQKGIEKFRPSKMRMEIIRIGGLTIINDVYNANPDSMISAVDVLAQWEGSRACILGDMLELGEYASALHYRVGEHCAQSGIEKIICAGPLAKKIADGAADAIKQQNPHGQMVYYYKTQEDMLNNIKNIIEPFDSVLVKASRIMKFENTVELLKQGV